MLKGSGTKQRCKDFGDEGFWEKLQAVEEADGRRYCSFVLSLQPLPNFMKMHNPRQTSMSICFFPFTYNPLPLVPLYLKPSPNFMNIAAGHLCYDVYLFSLSPSWFGQPSQRISQRFSSYMAKKQDAGVELSLSVQGLMQLGHDTYKCILDMGGSDAQGKCLKLEDDDNAGKAWYTFCMPRIHHSLLYTHGRYKVLELENRIYMVTETFSCTLDEWKRKLLEDELLHPDFVTILSDVMYAILFIYDHGSNHGNISSKNVYIVHGDSGVCAKVGKMGGQEGQNISGDLNAFAGMIENIFHSKGEQITAEVAIFLRRLRAVSTREDLTLVQNHVVLAPPDGRCAFRLIAWRKGEKINNNIARSISHYLVGHGLVKARWMNPPPCAEIQNLNAYKSISASSRNNPVLDFMTVTRAFAVHANDQSVRQGSKLSLKSKYIDHELNICYDGFLAIWYEKCVDEGIRFTPFRQ